MPILTSTGLGGTLTVDTETGSLSGAGSGSGSAGSSGAGIQEFDAQIARMYRTIMENQMIFGTGFGAISSTVTSETQEEKESLLIKRWGDDFVNNLQYMVNHLFGGATPIQKVAIKNDDFLKLCKYQNVPYCKEIVFPLKYGTRISIINADDKTGDFDWEKFTKEVDVK